jgi:HNH endonuclease
MLRIDGVRYGIHIWVCIAKHGPKPGPDYEACHGPCHNRSCINYRHLSWGTHQQNAQDRKRDGTQVTNRGSTNGQAKLKEEDVLKIRELYHVYGLSEAAIIRRFGLRQQHVNKIVKGVSWKHLPMPPMERKLIGPDLFA